MRDEQLAVSYLGEHGEETKGFEKGEEVNSSQEAGKKDHPPPGGRACTATARLTATSGILLSSRTLPNLGVNPAPQGPADAEAYWTAPASNFGGPSHALEQRAVGVGEHQQHHKMIR